ncbi:hypothetical protein O0I10_011184 [Lichtheimia ornata]|uniref:Chorismate-utilising enzyme C-terminal domain-containing protein n=1 Tax=Lichtheimia ornata TaxID=688661 RepID=A0AAD7XSU7_9FUNG|nr:uncharacterized protein O0I10_011184 [Lichtheimia ornata]KAJ8653135.1 hypothetical protein O0I10_011184 [Lichtheimia ornata]
MPYDRDGAPRSTATLPQNTINGALLKLHCYTKCMLSSLTFTRGGPLTAVKRELEPIRYAKLAGSPSFSWWCQGPFWLKVNYWIPLASDAIFMLCDTQRAEHLMLVDLGRNDVNHICRPRSVKVDKIMRIGSYSHVMHMDVSTSVAPKIRGLQKEKRGIYDG